MLTHLNDNFALFHKIHAVSFITLTKTSTYELPVAAVKLKRVNVRKDLSNDLLAIVKGFRYECIGNVHTFVRLREEERTHTFLCVNIYEWTIVRHSTQRLTVIPLSMGMFSSSFSYVRLLRNAAFTTMRRKLVRSCRERAQ